VTVASDPILIVGAGIGGLTAAFALARKGRRVVVLERSATLGEIGAGIQLGPNAFHAFDRLGIGDEARAGAVLVDQLQLMDAITGEQITALPTGEAFRERFGNPYAVVHRGELHGFLVRMCRENDLIELCTGSQVIDYKQDDKAIEVDLAGGVRLRGAALIAADGLWSKIRLRVAGDGPPRVSGHTSYRSVIPVELMPEPFRWNTMTIWAGPDCHIVHYPLSHWKSFNLVVTYHNHAPEPVSGVAVAQEEVLAGFRHIHEKVQALLGIGTSWKKWVLCDRDPVDRWVDGRVALLGDAAHPMLQYMAQGACQAIEDAVCLADMVGDDAEPIQRQLEGYQVRRYLRTARVQLMGREMGDHVFHPAGAHAALRNAIMSAKTPNQWMDELSWLYAPVDQ
jgi:salicylate hydroxylase